MAMIFCQLSFSLPIAMHLLLVRTLQHTIPRVMVITMAAKITLIGTTTAITIVVELLSPVEMYRPMKHTKYYDINIAYQAQSHL